MFQLRHIFAYQSRISGQVYVQGRLFYKKIKINNSMGQMFYPLSIACHIQVFLTSYRQTESDIENIFWSQNINIGKISRKQIESLSREAGGKGRGILTFFISRACANWKVIGGIFGPISRNSISNKNPYLLVSLLGKNCSNCMLNVLILLQNKFRFLSLIFWIEVIESEMC